MSQGLMGAIAPVRRASLHTPPTMCFARTRYDPVTGTILGTILLGTILSRQCNDQAPTMRSGYHLPGATCTAAGLRVNKSIEALRKATRQN